MTPKLHGLKQENVMVLNRKTFILPNLGRDWRVWLVSALFGVGCGGLETGGLELSGGLLTHVSASSAGKTQLGLENLGPLGLSLFLPLSIPLSLPP